MEPNGLQHDWDTVKIKIKERWNKLLDSDIDSVKNNLNLLTDKIQRAYDYTKDKAEMEFRDFKKSLESKAS